MEGLWWVDRYKVESDEFCNISGPFKNEEDAKISARGWYKVCNAPDPSDLEDKIPDRIYIVNPDGTKKRFVPDE